MLNILNLSFLFGLGRESIRDYNHLLLGLFVVLLAALVEVPATFALSDCAPER